MHLNASHRIAMHCISFDFIGNVKIVCAHLSLNRWNTMKTTALRVWRWLLSSFCSVASSWPAIRSPFQNASHFHTQQCVVVVVVVCRHLEMLLFVFLFIYFSVLFCLSLMDSIIFIFICALLMLLMKCIYDSIMSRSPIDSVPRVLRIDTARSQFHFVEWLVRFTKCSIWKIRFR